ncbi:hypothetical protein BGZ58_010146 [Dissophora ornata]|nr:hypothetical protein BGZ58_010146 [Dissophora ornata]
MSNNVDTQESASVEDQFSELKISSTSPETTDVVESSKKAKKDKTLAEKKLTILDDLDSDDESDEDFKPSSEDEDDDDSDFSDSDGEGDSDVDSDKDEGDIDEDEVKTLANEAEEIGAGLDVDNKVLRTGKVIETSESA